MLNDKQALLAIVARVETGAATYADALALRGLIQRVDELDDLVDQICSCRTQEIPIIRNCWGGPYDDVEPGNRP